MSTRFLLLWLEAPLQAWGADSKFGRRETLPFPTKSGVAGLLLASLGARGEQKEFLAELAPLRQTVLSYVTTQPDGSPKGRALFLEDFHMVGSGYDESDPWMSLHVPKKADGSKPQGKGTKVTHRFYIQDGKFAVVVEVPANRAEEFRQALERPCYDIYLGRKNCVPTDWVFRGLFDTEEAALAQAERIASEKNLKEDFRVVDGDASSAEGEVMTLNDVPVQFGEIKVYRDRRVSIIRNA